MLPANLKHVYICADRVDFRKRWNGLLAESYRLGLNPYSGDLIVFVKRDKRQLVAICGDERGLMLFSRRFEGGSLKFIFDESLKEITRAELLLWFEGTHFTILHKVKPWKT